MIEIPLTQGKVAFVDDQDAHLLNWKWYLHNNKYAARGYQKEKKGKPRSMFLHHCIIGFSINGRFVDHINGDTFDNRRINLRFVTHRENLSNQKCHRNGTKTSHYVGVYWNKHAGKWKSIIRLGKERKFLGYFKIEKEAGSAYQTALNGDSE